MKIVDALTLFNELDLLEIRLNSLAPYVDTFIIAEGDRTHAGDPKPFYFEASQERFAAFPITYVRVALPSNNEVANKSEPNWERENLQRQAIGYGVESLGLSGDDIILVSDLDEIPDLSSYEGEEGYFSQDLYYYYLNGYVSEDWHGSVAFYKRSFDVLGAQRARELRWAVPQVGKGWHYSYMGGSERVEAKIKAFAHQELNTADNLMRVYSRFASMQDPYGRDANIQIVDLDGPEWLLVNRDKYQHLIKEKA